MIKTQVGNGYISSRGSAEKNQVRPPIVEVCTPVIPIRNVGVVGARSLSTKYAEKIGRIVEALINHGFHIATGGALGTDDYVLSQLIAKERFDRGVIFSAWNTFKGFPVKVRKSVRTFHDFGGSIIWGDSTGAEHPSAIKMALLHRNVRLVDACEGITAFLTEQSRGTFFTVKKAVEKRKKLVVFPIDRELPGFQVVKWVPLKCGGIWDGAVKAVYLR